MNTPNKLTILRIILVPALLAAIYLIPEGWTASVVSAVLFILISLTDMFDGKIARRTNQITDFGKFLDPLADKILVDSVMIAFISKGYISSIAVIIVILREFTVTSLRLIAAGNNVVIAASYFGKIKTTLQMITIVVLMFYPEITALTSFPVCDILVWIMAFVTVLSGADYVIKNFNVIDFRK